MDIIVTVALIYLAYRGYTWYTSMQERVRSGPPPPTYLDDESFPTPEEDEGDYIDYEEVP